MASSDYTNDYSSLFERLQQKYELKFDEKNLINNIELFGESIDYLIHFCHNWKINDDIYKSIQKKDEHLVNALSVISKFTTFAVSKTKPNAVQAEMINTCEKKLKSICETDSVFKMFFSLFEKYKSIWKVLPIGECEETITAIKIFEDLVIFIKRSTGCFGRAVNKTFCKKLSLKYSDNIAFTTENDNIPAAALHSYITDYDVIASILNFEHIKIFDVKILFKRINNIFENIIKHTTLESNTTLRRFEPVSDINKLLKTVKNITKNENKKKCSIL